MKLQTTNYFNTLIEVAEDTPVASAEIPKLKGDKSSVANLQFELINKNPYQYTSDEVFFKVFAKRKELSDGEFEAARQVFFSKGQPCFRASPLTKRYGWGLNSDEKGRVALIAVQSDIYQKLKADNSIVKIKAMRSKR